MQYKIEKLNFMLFAIFFILNTTSPFANFFKIHKIESFANTTDNWINYLIISLIITLSFSKTLLTKNYSHPLIVYPILVYFSSLIIAAIFAPTFNKHVIWELIAYLVGLIFLISLFQNRYSKRDAYFLLWLIFISGSVQTIIAFFQFFSVNFLSFSFSVNELVGGFFQTNKFATYLASTLLTPLLFLDFHYSEKQSSTRLNQSTNYKNIILIIIILMIVSINSFCLSLTNSKVGILGFFIGLILISISRINYEKKELNF